MSIAPRVSMPLIAVLTLSSTAAVSEPTRNAQVDCADLGSFGWSGFRVDSAELIEATGDGTPHCRVQGTIDAEVHFELLLPVPDAWNGRFVMGGGGGFVGSVENQALGYAPYMLEEGFATVGTDTGHEASLIDASWAFEREDREINFGYRAVHMTVETAKTIMRLHYGRDIDYSYWLGCSRGGGQAMVESQRFPDDFDGIVAGAPAYDWPAIGAQFIRTQQAMYPAGPSAGPVISAEIRQLLSDVVLATCDDIDGLSDGVVDDPRDCPFRPEDLPRCVEPDTSSACFTDAQVRAIEDVYRGAVIEGEQIHPGLPVGAEVEWAAWVTGAPNQLGPGTPNLHFAFGTQMYKYLIFDDPDWDYSSYDFSNWARDTRRAGQILNATSTDLTAFKVGGGKLILWNGWADAGITALGTIEYYEAVQNQHPDSEDFARLFLLPGVGHCGGGPGPDVVDWLQAIQAWVEDGEAPARLTATKLNAQGEAEVTRPVCAYPAKARYDGEGDPVREESFECSAG